MNSYLKIAFALLAAVSVGGKSGPEKGALNQPEVIDGYKFLDINQINCTMNSDGCFVDGRRNGTAGLEWPKGSGKKAVYQAGVWLIGRHRPTGLLRTANMDYQVEYQPGPLMETYNTTTNDDAGPISRAPDNKYRLYKISKSDLLPGAPPNVDLTEWPGDLGAPYIDVNGDGKWTPGVDQPKFYGDQQLWCVVNDVNNARHDAVGTTHPMGVEVQCLYFAFNQPGSLGNTMFLKWTIINKSDADYDSTYTSMFCDVDLGNGNDDLPGCDTVQSLGYVYNGSNNDAGGVQSYGVAPPAAGFSFFVGPKVPGAPTDSAVVDGVWYKGYRNLPMTSYTIYTGMTYTEIIDPPPGNPSYPAVAYDYMKGLAGTAHQILISPTTGQPMYRWFSGDPVAGTGDLPDNFPLGKLVPQDVRLILSSGPFTLAKGDTQEVIGAFVIARGSDYLNSVTKLKQDVAAVKALYGSGPTVGVEEDNPAFGERFELMQNYPNPCNPSTKIGFRVGGLGSRDVKLVVVDLLGREVAVLVDEKKEPGSYEVKFDGSGLSSGVYFYRLRAGDFVETRKVLLMK